MKRLLFLCSSIFLLLSLANLFAVANDTLKVEIINSSKAVGSLQYAPIDSESLILRVMDEQGRPFKHLTKEQVQITKGAKKAKIIDVKPLEAEVGTALNILLVLDNSSSMSMHKGKLLESVDRLLTILGEKSRIAVVGFYEPQNKARKISFKDYKLNLKYLDFTTDIARVKEQVRRLFGQNEMSRRTYLNDAIVFAADTLKNFGKKGSKTLVIFSDGKDLGSKFNSSQALAALADVDFRVFTVDFGARGVYNPLLQEIAAMSQQNRNFKASKAAQLVPIFEKLSKEIITEFKVAYHFPIPPSGDIRFNGEKLTLRTRKIIDEFPMLNYVFFDSNSVDLSKKYILFQTPEEAANFDENSISKPLEKYYHILNVIGSRLQKDQSARITLVGCNMNLGAEKNNRELSRQRAEAVANYWEKIWNVDANRIKIIARNLPKNPSSRKTAEGCAENRRVEILSNKLEILAPIMSEIQEVAYSPEIGEFKINVNAPEGLDYYEITARSGEMTLMKKRFTEVKPIFNWNWLNDAGEKINGLSEIWYGLMIKDKEGAQFQSQEQKIPVEILEETGGFVEVKEDTVYQKFGLVLFPFNSANLDKKNSALLKKIVKVYKEHPDCYIKVFGYCDDIGAEEYNMKLSQKRAKAACRILRRLGVPKGKMLCRGYGEINPIFSNATPEGRFLNRTVQIYVLYPRIAE